MGIQSQDRSRVGRGASHFNSWVKGVIGSDSRLGPGTTLC